MAYNSQKVNISAILSRVAVGAEAKGGSVRHRADVHVGHRTTAYVQATEEPGVSHKQNKAGMAGGLR